MLEVSFYLPGLNVATADFASVASFYTPAEDVLPAEYGVIIIWDGSSGQQFNAGNFSVQVCVQSHLGQFIQNPKQGDIVTQNFDVPTGGSTTVRDTTTRGGRPPYEIRFNLQETRVTLTNDATYVIGFAAKTFTQDFGELFVPTASHEGPSDVQAGDLVLGCWRYLVEAGGSTVYSGQLATELIVQPIIVLPQLQVRRLSGAVEVCWPASATDFQLEAAAGLASPLNWLPVEEEAIEQEGQLKIVLPATAPRSFCRLRK